MILRHNDVRFHHFVELWERIKPQNDTVVLDDETRHI